MSTFRVSLLKRLLDLLYYVLLQFYRALRHDLVYCELASKHETACLGFDHCIHKLS